MQNILWGSPWIGIGDIEPLTQKLVRVPLKHIAGELPKHLHLHGGLLVSHIVLGRHELFHKVSHNRPDSMSTYKVFSFIVWHFWSVSRLVS